MNELEQYLSEFGLYADVWTDDEGLHVHDWDTDECSVFAHDVDFEEVREHIVASRHALVLDVCKKRNGRNICGLLNDTSPNTKRGNFSLR